MSDEHEPPLDDAELRRIRSIIESDEFASRFWATARRWAAWIVATVTAIWAIFQVISDAAKNKFGV